jgi:hypothetical protein
MPITIERVGSLYVATATPPHSDVEYVSEAPEAADAVIDALRARGCHQTDIGDAFYAADPDWLSR